MFDLRHGLAVGALLAVGATPIGCEEIVSCFDNECNGGLLWSATTADDLPMQPGEYSIEVELEGDVLTIACTVDNDGEGQCGTPQHVQGDRDFRVSVERAGELVVHLDADTTETSYGFDIRANEWVEGGVQGPIDIRVTLERDGTTLLEDQATMEYERDDEFHGDPRCGFCDLSEARATVWNQ